MEIVAFERRRGKAATLNDLMTQATQPVFVMMDARQRVEALYLDLLHQRGA